MTRPDRPKSPPKPLDAARIEELALFYVGRFATTRAKLATYLKRKLRERGWDGDGEPPIAELVEKLSRLGYIDDAAFALSKARSLGQRGFGPRRVSMALHQAGVGEEDGRAAKQVSAEQEISAALRFAQRRRAGPFASAKADPRDTQRLLSAMLRAGHDFALSRRIIAMEPDGEADIDGLVARLSNIGG